MRGELGRAGELKLRAFTPRMTRAAQFMILGVLLVFGLLIALNWSVLHPLARQLAHQLYLVSGGLYSVVSTPLNNLRLALGTNPLAPFLLGMMGATAPCQLSTGAVTLAFIASDQREGGAIRRAFAYTAARVLFYAVVGGAVVLLVRGQVYAPGEFFTGVRKVFGPLTLMAGLVTLGVLRPRFQLGDRLAARVQMFGEARGGVLGAFLLGLAFSLAFCPTLFFLFFGATLPLAAQTPLGVLYPALFALGMSLPILTLAALVPNNSRKEALKTMRGWHRFATPIAGMVFVLVGVYDTFLYWLY